MSIDDDELIVIANQLASDSPTATDTMRDAIVKTVVSLVVPFGIGTAVTALVTEEADRRWKARVSELMEMFAERVAALGAAIISPDYFKSEEFQALMLEAIDQERTNRFQMKRKMLAQGLANSGAGQFIQEDSKDTFFRIMRDLTPQDIHALREMSQTTNKIHMGLVMKEQTKERTIRASSVTPRIFRCQGLGLVSTVQKLPQPNLNGLRNLREVGQIIQLITKALDAEPQVTYAITGFGERFLKFLTDESVA